MQPESTRAGYVALVGMPNAGKSSLLNRLLDQKLSIVTPAAQTTRERVVGIHTQDGVQSIYVDTPGLVDPRYSLHHSMLHSAAEALRGADVAVWVADPASLPSTLPTTAAEILSGLSGRLLVALNKADTRSDALQEVAGEWARETLHAPSVAVSARTGEGIPELRRAIAARLPPSPFLFPEEEVATQSLRYFAAELIRETLFELYGQEVPYSTAVAIEEFREGTVPVYIRSTIYVERQSQKAILVGTGGAAMKRLGREARKKIEILVESRVYLDLWVKVLPRWRKDPNLLRRLGYFLPS